MSSRLRTAVERHWREAPCGTTDRLVGAALVVASALFDMARRARALVYRLGLRSSERLSVPVVSIGSLEVGGTGKTPLVLEVTRRLAQMGARPAIVTRGYGGAAKLVQRVHVADDVSTAPFPGDEPLWLARAAAALPRFAGVWVAARKRDAARAAIDAGADVLVLDDGFQHWAIARDLDIVTLDAARPIANGRLLPRGPLREPPSALSRADLIVLAGGSAGGTALPSRAPQLSWRGEFTLRSIFGDAAQAGEPARLIVGIAHPERVSAALEQLGLPPGVVHRFPDHHAFRREELEPLMAEDRGALWLTTEKDWIRLERLQLAWSRLSVIEQTLRWNEADADARWDALLAKLLQVRKPPLRK